MLRFAVRALALAGLVATSTGAPVAAGGADVTATSMGVSHSCALRADHTVWCWGGNEFGQLADGTPDDQPTPVQVMRAPGEFLTGIGRLASSSGDHTCGIKLDATLRCWGFNINGELGDGTNSPRPYPVKVIVLSSGLPLANVAAVAVADNHSCAVRTNGRVWCWGFNGSGRLGDGTTDPRLAAVPVKRGTGLLTGVKAIAVGTEHSCALITDGTVRCWGENEKGELGDGTATDRHTPVKVRLGNGSALQGVTAIAAGLGHTCALLTDRTVRCWGFNGGGQLGDGTTHNRDHPVKVQRGSGDLTGVRRLAAGSFNTCATTTSLRVLCWGDNEDGQIGDGTFNERHKATLVRLETGPFTDVRAVRVSGDHACALRDSTTVWCWGLNTSGQVGSGSPDPKVPFPEKISFP